MQIKVVFKKEISEAEFLSAQNALRSLDLRTRFDNSTGVKTITLQLLTLDETGLRIICPNCIDRVEPILEVEY